MKKYFLLISFLFLFLHTISYSQVESVPINNSVYTFLKEMKVKGILSFIREDDPILSRFEVKDLLNTVAQYQDELSSTEMKLLKKYQIEFISSISG